MQKRLDLSNNKIKNYCIIIEAETIHEIRDRYPTSTMEEGRARSHGVTRSGERC